jgi:hypothetical protein
MPYVSVKISDGWGNQMFKVAAMLGYAEKHGHTPVFLGEPAVCREHGDSQLRIRDQFPEIAVVPLETGPWTVLKEPADACFTHLDLPRLEGNVLLDGYFQSYKYLPSRPLPAPTMTSAVIPLLAEDWTDSVFVHVRRGDFMHPLNAHHRIDLIAYIRKCLLEVKQGAKLFVVSDDMPWCKQELPKLLSEERAPKLLGEERAWIWCPEKLSDRDTIALMSLCEGGICANSTFSWWAAYFLMRAQDDAKVFMPSPWGFPPLPPARDIHPPWCKVVDA